MLLILPLRERAIVFVGELRSIPVARIASLRYNILIKLDPEARSFGTEI